MPNGRVQDPGGEDVHDLGQQEWPASAPTMVINGLHEGIMMGG